MKRVRWFLEREGSVPLGGGSVLYPKLRSFLLPASIYHPQIILSKGGLAHPILCNFTPPQDAGPMPAIGQSTVTWPPIFLHPALRLGKFGLSELIT